MTHSTHAPHGDQADAHERRRAPVHEPGQVLGHEPRAGEHAGQDERRGRTARGEAQRRALVLAAYDLIAEEGFEGLRTRGVAARAGVNIATLHYYFATKEDLISAVVAHLWDEFVTIHAPEVSETPTPLEGLRAELVDLDYHLREHPTTFVVLFEIVLRALRNRAIAASSQQLTLDWQRHIKTFLVAGVEQGEFAPDLDTDAVAAEIVALLTGNLSLAMMFARPFPVERVFGHIQLWLAR